MENKTSVKRASTLGVICYGLGDLASQFIWTFVGSYLTIFYTDIVGLSAAAISAIMLIARIWLPEYQHEGIRIIDAADWLKQITPQI